MQVGGGLLQQTWEMGVESAGTRGAEEEFGGGTWEKEQRQQEGGMWLCDVPRVLLRVPVKAAVTFMLLRGAFGVSGGGWGQKWDGTSWAQGDNGDSPVPVTNWRLHRREAVCCWLKS